MATEGEDAPVMTTSTHTPSLTPEQQQQVVTTLTTLTKSHRDRSTRAAIRAIRQACKTDIAELCGSEATALKAVVSHRTVMDPDLLLRTMQTVHMCMQEHVMFLSAGCTQAILTPPAPEAAVPSLRTARDPIESGRRLQEKDGQHKRKKYRDDHHDHHHHHHYHHDSADDLAFEAHLRYLANYEHQNKFHDRPLRLMDSGKHRHHHPHDGVHPFLWLVILPFFCLGVYTAMKHGLEIYRKHQRQTKHAEYEPLQECCNKDHH